MAILFAERVRVSTASTGSGTITLGAAPSGYRTFAQAVSAGQLVSGCSVYYAIDDGASWETGQGIYTGGTETLTRVVAASSSGTSAISLTLAAMISLTLTAGCASPVLSAAPSVSPTFTGNVTVAGGFITMSSATTAALTFSTGPGVAAPSFPARSAGTRLVLKNTLSGSATDFAFGMSGNTLWMGIPGGASFAWYGGTSIVASLSQAGVLTLPVGGVDSTVIGATTPAVGTFTALTAPTLAAGTSNTQAATTAFLAPALNDVGRNRLHNARFRIQTRGTSFTSLVTPAYTADRWVGTSSISSATVAFATTAGYGPSGAVCVMTLPVTTGSPTVQISQRISGADCSDLSGQTVTISWYGSASVSGSCGYSVSILLQTTSALDNWGATITDSVSQSVPMFTSANRGSCTFVMPTVTNGAQLVMRLTGTSASGTGTVTCTLSSVQLEVGPNPTTFEQKPTVKEQIECSRYYQVVAVSARGYLFAPVTYISANVPFSRMRISPTAALITAATSTSTTLGTAIFYVVGANSGRYEIKTNGSSGDIYSLNATYGLSADL